VRAYGFSNRGVAYRLVYTLEADIVLIVAIGPHDAAYARAKRR
jgi:mRNA-degrading endonuclease RelE of RelBE toxin-antitoxin system